MNKLTEQEEEAMQAIWKSGGGFIREFHDSMSDQKPPYTTLASTIKNLEKKKFIRADKVGIMNRYIPLIKEEDYKKTFMKDFVKDYFKNSYKDLVASFVAQENLSADDLKEIISLIENPKDN